MFNMHVRTRERDGYITVALRGELDLANAADVTAALLTAVSRGPLIIVDLAGLNFIDVSGVAALVCARGRARSAGGDLYLRAPQAQALKILAIMGPSTPSPCTPPRKRRPTASDLPWGRPCRPDGIRAPRQLWA